MMPLANYYRHGPAISFVNILAAVLNTTPPWRRPFGQLLRFPEPAVNPIAYNPNRPRKISTPTRSVWAAFKTALKRAMCGHGAGQPGLDKCRPCGSSGGGAGNGGLLQFKF